MKRLCLPIAIALMLATLCGCALNQILPENTPSPAAPAGEAATAEPTETPIPRPTATRIIAGHPASAATSASNTATPTQTPASGVSREEALSLLTMKEPAPDFTLISLDGEQVSLSDFQGKFVFLTFWQTWCGPCRMEMPYFENLIQENSDVVVVAVATLAGESVSYARAEQAVRDYIEEGGFTFTVLIDPAKQDTVSSVAAYASQYIPVNLAIDKQGNIRYRQDGAYNEAGLPILLDYLRALDE